MNRKPIFIVGVPRSGTTLVYRKLAAHPDLAWISKTSRKFPRSVWLTRLIGLFHHDNRPTESSWIWSRYCREEDDALTAADLTDEARRFYGDIVEAQCRLAGRPRFLCKYPRNALRMDYIRALFPEAVFCHVIRDGRAVVASLLRCREWHGGLDRYWGVRPPGWRAFADKGPAVSCAYQWRRTIEVAREQAVGVGDRYQEIRYEDFVAHPTETLAVMGRHADLSWPPDVLARQAEGVEDRTSSWREVLTADQIRQVNEVQRDLLVDLGYEV